MLRRLTRTGLRKGLLEGSRPWLVVGATAGVVRLASRVVRKTPDVVFCQELQPGEALVIKHAGGEPELIRAT